MKYTYTKGIEGNRFRGRNWVVVAAVAIFAGGYTLLNMTYPTLPVALIEGDTVAKRLLAEQPKAEQDRIYIPQLGVDLPIAGAGAGLDSGAAQRAPESGNPQEGGNFVVTARQFHLALTPVQTRAQSPFYHLKQLTVGEQIYVDYDGKRYAYEIQEKVVAPADTTSLEKRSDEPQLTLYAADGKSGQPVVIAKPIGTVAWVNGQPKLKSL